ncbi:MAG: hypothetical protein ACI3Y5_08760 [Prevotella sp.]
MPRLICLSFAILLLAACDNSNPLKTIDEIKARGDTDPAAALCMLDSLNRHMDGADEYARMKCVLLGMRLRDKIYMPALTDDSAKIVTTYFAEKGSEADRQEAYYYAGSVYRDMDDTPRALQNFLMAEEVAVDSRECDSLLLRNTYSNIGCLLFNVQDYRGALEMAKREYNVSEKTGRQNFRTTMHVGEAYLRVDSMEKAAEYFSLAERLAGRLQGEDAYSLLYNFAYLGKKAKADTIYRMIMSGGMKASPMGEFALARYYEMSHDTDSAIACYTRIMQSTDNIVHKYDAARMLFSLFKQKGDHENSTGYADLFMQLSDSIDFGKRQELATTVNNKFKYRRDAEEEDRIKEDNSRYRNIILYLLITIFNVTLLAALVYYYIRSRHLKQLISADKRVRKIQTERDATKAKAVRIEEEYEDTKAKLEAANSRLADVVRETERIEIELREKEMLLSEKLDQNKRFIRLLHKADMEEKAKDVVAHIRKAAVGRYDMSATDWQRLYHAVDELQPDLMERMMRNLGTFTEQQQQVCYLKSIGLTNIQIENLTRLPHVTVWRWTKKFSWI